MENQTLKEKKCRLCFNKIVDEHYRIVDDFMKETILIILLKLDLKANHLICSDCVPKVFAAFDFKASCLSMENEIVTYINSEDDVVDLREVYMKEGLYEDAGVVKLEEDQKICRLCVQLISSDFTPFSEVDQNLVSSYIPEVHPLLIKSYLTPVHNRSLKMDNGTCVFCGNENEDLKTIKSDAVKEILAVVLYKVNWDDESENCCMCKVCSSKLNEAFHFKAERLYMENKIVSHINLEKPCIDLKEISTNKNSSEPVTIAGEDEKICRLCLKSATNFTPYENVETEVIKKCIPEIDFNISKDPVICMSCCDSLYIHAGFIKTCLAAHGWVENTSEVPLRPKEVSDAGLTDSMDVDGEDFVNVPIKTEAPDGEDKTLVVVLNKVN